MIQTSQDSNFHPAARLGPNHGYCIEGDIALLHAEVEVPRDLEAARQWALQLWACEAPHAGGPLSGVKVAEAALPAAEAPVAEQPLRLDAEALARVPGGQRDYAMVLVLASGEAGRFNQVHDFANYASRQRFITPHLEGSVGYRVDGDAVTLSAERVRNPRSNNLSGSLRLELWALPQPYRGGSVAAGHPLAGIDLGLLEGDATLEAIAQRTPFQAPPAGEWHVSLILREWAGSAGYVTRDHAGFAIAYTTSEPEPVAAAPVAEAPAPRVSAPVAAAAPAAAPVATRAPAPVAAPTPAPDSDGRVSLMHASLEELTAVKGLNKKLAAEIIKHRPFKSVDELLKVRGIGSKMLASLRPRVKL